MPSAEVKSGRKQKFVKWARVSYMLLLFCSTVLVVALLAYLAFSRPAKESQYVNTNEYQAVFLNSPGTNTATADRLGNVYFGKITSINGDYVRLTNVFYLKEGEKKEGETGTTLDVVKLGCTEVHKPSDEMIINKENVVFWENLKSDSQVVNKISEIYKQYPTGCAS